MSRLSWLFPTPAAAVEVGGQAPDFALPDQHGRPQRLTDYRGRWLVLYFYPKDDTPGCTTEACDFREGYLQFTEANAAVLGVSLDDAASHAAFAAKYGLPFPLLVDAGGKVARTYGVLRKLGPLSFARRQTFIIDPQGRIARHFASVRPRGHAHAVAAALHEAMGNPSASSD